MTEKIAIYTCIIGGYDELQQPVVTAEGFDFICFVGPGEKTAGRIGVWEIREFDVHGITDAQLQSRYPKMHPHELLPEYEASVWIDGNIRIADGTIYKAARIKFASGVRYSGVGHPSRDCTYGEARKCRDMKYISNLDLLRIWIVLFVKGLPRHAGLMENNLIFRRHNDPDIIAMDGFWWGRVLHFCRRDQLSLMLSLRRFGIRVDYLLPPGQNTRNNPGFKYLLHK